MDRGTFEELYNAKYGLFLRLLTNVKEVVLPLIQLASAPVLNVDQRIKTVDSSFEKMGRKRYNDPFSEIEDFCGLRVICYYPSDVDRVAALFRHEFNVMSEENTQLRMQPNEFGYRSTHLIIAIPDSWLLAPQYRGLEGLKVEVQIRTVLMHAWAEIQHKLAYKSADQVPVEFQRKLFRLSAKFEEADEQLEQIRVDLTAYRAAIKSDANEGYAALRTKQLNLDTLTVLLDTAFPTRSKSPAENANLLGELLEVSLGMSDLIDALSVQKPILEKLERREYGEDTERHWAQVGALRNALDIANDKYYSYRLNDLAYEPMWLEPTEYGRRLLQ